MKNLRVIVAITAFALAVLPWTRPRLAAQAAMVTQRDVAVPMRDGVVLRADVLRPAPDGRYPTLVYRTPYGKGAAQKEYATFRKAVERGYVVVIQDVRGRYASAGNFNAYYNEGRDGYDTIEWAAAQPWSNGHVGTFGLSYPGAVQWLAAVEHPPHLRAMAPAMTFATPRYFFYSGGAFDMSWPAWILNNIAPDVREKKGLAGPRTGADAEAAWKRDHARIEVYLPLLSLPDLREVAPWYYEWLRHPPTDSWWDWAELRGKYHGVTAAVLNISGWYDEGYGPDGATTNFGGLLAARKDQADPRTALVLGPWVHGVDATTTTRSGEREFGQDAAIDYDDLVLSWLDRYLRDDAGGWKLQKPVRYFVMGENAWRDADSWPPPSRALPLFFASAAEGSTRGALRATPARGVRASQFASDPAHPFTDPYGDAYGAHDYQKVQRGGGNSLVFDSAPFEDDTDAVGRIAADIYFSCDCPDADLWVRLYDVAPDGTSFNLMSPGLDVLRASYSSTASRALLDPGKPYRLHFASLNTANRFLKGHRLRVQISGEFFPHFSRNLHTGRSEAETSEMRPATITILHDASHPSRLVLPVTNGTPTRPPDLGGKPVERRDIPPGS
jgi:putative CocE/NonD family hydrolase